MNYFKDCETNEEVKKVFHKLAKEMHPDNGGDPEAFKEMKAQFEKAFEDLKTYHKNVKGEKYTKECTEDAGAFADIIEKLIHIQGIKVEICGSWLWVSGDTRPCKDQLKEMHFGWSKNKAAWYLHFEPFRKSTKKGYSLEQIRDMFGSQEFTTQGFRYKELEAAI